MSCHLPGQAKVVRITQVAERVAQPRSFPKEEQKCLDKV